MACTNYLFNQQKIIDEVRKTKKNKSRILSKF